MPPRRRLWFENVCLPFIPPHAEHKGTTRRVRDLAAVQFHAAPSFNSPLSVLSRHLCSCRHFRVNPKRHAACPVTAAAGEGDVAEVGTSLQRGKRGPRRPEPRGGGRWRCRWRHLAEGRGRNRARRRQRRGMRDVHHIFVCICCCCLLLVGVVVVVVALVGAGAVVVSRDVRA